MSSQQRIAKLNQLLARVEQRRQEPRLLSVAGLARDPAARSENTNVAAKAPAVRAVPAEAPDSFDEAFADLTGPSSMPPPAPAAPVAAAAVHVPSEERASSSLPPPAPVAAALGTSEPPQRSATEVLPAVQARIPPSPALPFDSAVRVTSSPRIDAARSFGELLELSLSLRPKS
jgi:hypothetical protein